LQDLRTIRSFKKVAHTHQFEMTTPTHPTKTGQEETTKRQLVKNSKTVKRTVHTPNTPQHGEPRSEAKVVVAKAGPMQIGSVTGKKQTGGNVPKKTHVAEARAAKAYEGLAEKKPVVARQPEGKHKQDPSEKGRQTEVPEAGPEGPHWMEEIAKRKPVFARLL
jgi:hypothetical protein